MMKYSDTLNSWRLSALPSVITGFTRPDWLGYRIFSLLIQVIFGYKIIQVAAQGNLYGSLQMSAFFLLTVLFTILNKRLPSLFEFIFAGNALYNSYGWALNLYNMPGLFDEFAHLGTACSLTILISYLLLINFRKKYSLNLLEFIIFSVSIVVFLGTVWEIAEWFGDLYFNLDLLQGFADTMSDLLLDVIGAFIGVFISYILFLMPSPS